MQKYLSGLITIIILNLAAPLSVHALAPVILEKGKGKYPLGPHLEILEDPGGKLSYQDVLGPGTRGRWYKNQSETPNFGISDSAYWLRIKIKNRHKENKNMLLVLAWPLHDYIDVYIDNGKGDVREIKTGDLRPFRLREKKHRHFLFEVQAPPMQVVGIHLRIKAHGRIHDPIPLTLWESDEFHAEDPIVHYFLGALLGILAVMAIYNLFIFFSLRDISYLYYVLFLLGVIIWLMSSHGFAFMLFWPDSPSWGNRVTPLSNGFGMGWLFLFTRSYLNTAKNTPKLDIFFKLMVGLSILIMAFAFFGSYSTSVVLSVIVGMVGTIVALLTGTICLRQGHRQARYYLLAFFMIFCGAILLTLRVSGVLPSNFFTENSIFMGYVPGVVLLSLGLADRINVMREENDASREHALQIQKEAAENLEHKVEERTHELAQVNEKLQRMDRAKTRFFANMSHEFRTPLTLILAPVESIINGDYGVNINRKNEIFRSLLQNGLRLFRLINNLLDFTRIEAGRMSAKKQRTDMGRLLEYYKRSVYAGAEARGLCVVFKDHTGGCVAYIDQDLMEKAVMNLLSNAFKFTPAGGEIIVRLDKVDEGSCAISVQDTGIGVPADMLETIFKRFSQVDESASRKYEGTGIGLSLTREIAELHGGAVTVESQPGQGSLFTLTFQIGQADDETSEPEEEFDPENAQMRSYHLADLTREAPGSEERAPAGRESLAEVAKDEARDRDGNEPRLLIVEDNRDMRSFLRTLLESNYIVETAANGKEGLARIREATPDLILSDVMMPEMDGYELTQKLKSASETRDIPVVLLSARADAIHRIEGLEFGADDYLSKPFNSIELLARIRNQLTSKRLERELKEEKQERDLDFLQASRVQKNILTSRRTIRKIEELEIEYVYLPLNEQISGDYYNVSQTHKDTTSVFLADATGHGTQAALSTMQIDILYRESLEKQNPHERLEYINKKFVSEIRGKNLFTAINVDIAKDCIRYSSAGHPEQLLIQPGKSKILNFRTRGKIAGILENQPYETKEIEIEKGDILLLFSDGIFEVFTSEREEFGEERLLATLQAGFQSDLFTRSVEEIIRSIIKHVDDFRGEAPLRDDITLFGIRMK